MGREGSCQISNASKKMDALGQGRRKGCDPNQAHLRAFMYDLPPEFHFGLLGWTGKANQTWPNVSNPGRIPSYPGGLNLQHSIEYWLTLDLLSSDTPNIVRPCSAIRVKNSSQADIIFVPFFSSLSYNRHSRLHGKEKDHLIVAHHPNSMLDARKKLGSAMFVLADFGRYPVEIANIDKDVIAPYKHVLRSNPVADSATFEERPILVYFQGAIYRKDGGAIRQELYYLLRDEKDVHFTHPSSNRLFDAIVSHCVPVIISDEIELPFEDVLDYSEFCIFVRASDAVKNGFLLNLLRGIEREKWTKMWERLKEIAHHFEYQYPSQAGDAVDMIWGAVSRKISSIQNKLHRKNRYRRSQILLKRN
ncbi:putative arabinosyltransferase ARAD1 [Vitis vinifera]|uniref:Putative arabinosyltransferase ARAD1 n=1 Tax=Vitis vinifera TaxID=29760 RepID=A0A438I1D1_VITVI|nr:putative arabinosyltransferase ARAD1 [Vitis vinifera]